MFIISSMCIWNDKLAAELSDHIYSSPVHGSAQVQCHNLTNITAAVKKMRVRSSETSGKRERHQRKRSQMSPLLEQLKLHSHNSIHEKLRYSKSHPNKTLMDKMFCQLIRLILTQSVLYCYICFIMFHTDAVADKTVTWRVDTRSHLITRTQTCSEEFLQWDQLNSVRLFFCLQLKIWRLFSQ